MDPSSLANPHLLPESKNSKESDDNFMDRSPPKASPKDNREVDLIQARQIKQKQLMIEQLKKLPIVENCCLKLGLGRATHYRWLKEDEDYKEKVTEAILEGKRLMNDMAENNLLSLVQNKYFPAIQLWLRTNHNDYRNRLEVTGKIATTEKPDLTPEQKEAIEEALRLASSNVPFNTLNLQQDGTNPANSHEPTVTG